MKVISEHGCHGGKVGIYSHTSAVNHCDMRFSVFVPAQATHGKVPLVTFLSGLTCTEETFMIKSGAQRIAAELGLMLMTPDTSPRGEGVPDDPDAAYDFGLAAGFYLNATQAPWNLHYHMYDYVTKELPALIANEFPADLSRQGIFGHSMGGHGALTLGLKNPQRYKSISAFAPICNPTESPWGIKAFSHYLGDNKASWQAYDACALAQSIEELPRQPILIDQGLADQYLEAELRPEAFETACSNRGIAIEMRRHAGYDHGYYFISTFMEDHLRHHAAILGA